MHTLYQHAGHPLSPNGYVHGYSTREHERLQDQANTLTELLHHDTHYPPGSKVLEAGCGVGAQTVILAGNSPQAQFTSIDISQASLANARQLIEHEGIANVAFRQADIFDLPFENESFDHVFVCFVLEHLPNPLDALKHLQRVVKRGGTMTVIEGDHESAYFYPRSREAKQTIQCLIDIQAKLGGDSLVGRQLFPLLTQARFRDVTVSPRMVYVDSSKPDLVEGFTKNTFIAMVEGVQQDALKFGMMEPEIWEKGIADLYRTTRSDGTFCYTFFKGIAVR